MDTRIKIEIKTDNAAFTDGNRPHELARILQKIADNLVNGGEPGALYDYNGNRVGDYSDYTRGE